MKGEGYQKQPEFSARAEWHKYVEWRAWPDSNGRPSA
jgi:hypothetical protein